jgi:hypothetical protein
MTKDDMRRELDDMIKVVGALMDRLTVMRKEMHNRSPLKRAPSVSRRISPQMRKSIIYMYENFPHMTMSQIAHAHGLNSEGRISEIVRGKRRKSLPPQLDIHAALWDNIHAGKQKGHQHESDPHQSNRP